MMALHPIFAAAATLFCGGPVDLNPLAAVATVRGVGVYEPASRFPGGSEITDWRKLASLLSGKDKPAKWLAARLSEPARAAIADAECIDSLSGGARSGNPVTKRHLAARTAILNSLEAMVGGPSLYRQEVFEAVQMDDQTLNLIKMSDARTAVQTAQMNLRLISLALPGAVAMPPKDFLVTRVALRAKGKTFLVLSSYKANRWHIQLEGDAELSGVLVLGYEPQDVVGLTCPAVNMSPSTFEAGEARVFAFPYNISSRDYDRYVNDVQSLTGKSVDSFQGSYQPPKSGFVVGRP